MTRRRLDRRDFLKLTGLTAGLSLAGLSPRPARAALHLGDRFVQQVDHAELYMTHYAFFEEPDPGIVDGLYIDAATGHPTRELFLTPPLVRHAFRRAARNATRSSARPTRPSHCPTSSSHPVSRPSRRRPRSSA